VSEIDAGGERYLEATVKETLRARPAVPIVARKVRAPVTIAGYQLPAGTVLLASVYLVHNDPDVYPDPEAFRPERFIDGIANKRAWIPFGGGVRRCLGASFAQLEMKITLRTVFSELELEAVDKDPEEAVRKRFTFVPRKSTRVRSRPRRQPIAPEAPQREHEKSVAEPVAHVAGELNR
jgi:cytochrome P450